jgi:hypothetical protein
MAVKNSQVAGQTEHTRSKKTALLSFGTTMTYLTMFSMFR